MNADLDQSLSRALFSLPIGIETVGDGIGLQAVARAKQASVLFDEIVVESGLRVVEIGSAGVAGVMQQPPSGLSAALLHTARNLTEGTKYGIAVAATESGVEIHFGTDLPRIEGARYIEKEVVARYLCEYHTGLLEELASLGANWVQVISIERSPGEELKVIDERLEQLSGDGPNTLSSAIELTPEQARQLSATLNSALDEITADTEPELPSAVMPQEAMLATDLAEGVSLGDKLGATPALSSTFAEVAADRGVPIGLPGAESLGFIVPNFSVLPWEAVAEFRDHAGALEARVKLREFEAEAAANERDQSAAFVRATARAVSDGLMGAVKDLAPSLPNDLRSPLLGTAVGFVPIVGQYASLAISMGDMIAAIREHERFEGSWLAAVFELRDTAIDATIDF